MGEVCIITGGGSGIGFAIASHMPKEKTVVICGRSSGKLENAVKKLKECGYQAYFITCDVSDRKEVHELFLFARSYGTIKTVIHAAGLSPAMSEPEKLIRVNAIGTKNVNMESVKFMSKGGVIIDVASNSAYAVPDIMKPRGIYKLAELEEENFIRKMLGKSNLPHGEYKKAGLAYALSKDFVIWYAQRCAFKYGKRRIRVCSVSPGLIDTDMGNLEKKEGEELIWYSAEERMGKADELGFAIAAIADERNGYLAGVDVLIDGGSTNGKKFKRRRKK